MYVCGRKVSRIFHEVHVGAQCLSMRRNAQLCVLEFSCFLVLVLTCNVLEIPFTDYESE